MRIGINLFDVVPGRGRGGGGETYTTQLVRHLAQIDRDNAYVLFVNTDNRDHFRTVAPAFEQYTVPLDSKWKWTRLVWEQVGLPVLARKLRLDVLHLPFNTSPLAAWTPIATTVHDLGHFHYGARRETDTLRMRIQRFLLRHGTSRSQRIIAVSHFTRTEIERFLDVPPARVTVVHEAQTGFRPIERARRAGQRIVLAVTSDALHKNIPRLVKSLAHVEAPDFRLVIVGSMKEESTRQSVGRRELLAIAHEAGVADRVDILGFVPHDELVALYQAAACLVFPSLYEGFGLPVLEAMASGLPLLVSRAGSLPEVAGDCVLYFDPLDERDIAGAITRALSDPDQLDALVARGLERVRLFSWEKAARETLSVYREIGSRP